MVQMTNIPLPTSVSNETFLPWCRSLVFDQSNYSAKLFEVVVELLKIAQVKPDSEELHKTSVQQAFTLASILSELRVDSDTLVAAMLYPFVNLELLSLKQITENCGDEVATKIRGVLVMDSVRGLQTDRAVGSDSVQIENIRKMLFHTLRHNHCTQRAKQLVTHYFTSPDYTLHDYCQNATENLFCCVCEIDKKLKTNLCV